MRSKKKRFGPFYLNFLVLWTGSWTWKGPDQKSTHSLTCTLQLQFRFCPLHHHRTLLISWCLICHLQTQCWSLETHRMIFPRTRKMLVLTLRYNKSKINFVKPVYNKKHSSWKWQPDFWIILKKLWLKYIEIQALKLHFPIKYVNTFATDLSNILLTIESFLWSIIKKADTCWNYI